MTGSSQGRGRFISFEGGEGAGKSTQARLLAAALEALGCKTLLTREPGGTTGAEAIRNLLLSNEGEGWTPRAEALLFAAARSDHVSRAIIPALDAGTWVICDRYLDSSRAYQAGEGGLTDQDIQSLHAIGSDGLLPDCTVLLEANPGALAARLAKRDGDQSDRIGGREAAYHAKVRQRFAAYAKADPARFCVISGDGDPQDIHEALIERLSQIDGWPV